MKSKKKKSRGGVRLDKLLFTALTILVTLSSSGGSEDICHRRFFRNNVSDLKRMEGCRVIEGSVQISLIDSARPDEFRNLSFPELREITGYLVVTYAPGLETLANIFPNLAVIRGQELIHNYALLINDMPDMKEIGLPSLTNISRGLVWIHNNPNLCYVDTIDWSKIVNDTSGLGIHKNKPSSECLHNCPESCPRRDFGDNQPLCWSNLACQVVVGSKSCGCEDRPCYKTPSGDYACCHKECLGGCSGGSPTECFVCKNVEYNKTCVDMCPPFTYKYLNRRCVTADECSSLQVPVDPQRSEEKGSKLLAGKILQEEGECLLECPKSYVMNYTNGRESCQKCEGHCKKNCTGLAVDSVQSVEKLKGCTRITGALKIQIRGYSKNLAKELEKNLDMIEEIDDYLMVAYSYSLFSLQFFKSLKFIHGKKLEEGRYAIVVKSNENIQELWNSTHAVVISNDTARVLFHYNPKLCPNKIYDFVSKANISIPTDAKMDIGVTNGDKVPCNTKMLEAKVLKTSNSSVTIIWENFRRNLTETNHLLNYEVYYKEAPQNVSKNDDRDPCGNDDWKVLDVAKMSDRDKGSAIDEPKYEDEKIITNLKYFTRYAYYVKTVVIPDENSPNNNTGAESDIDYFTTNPAVPTVVQDVQILSNSSNELLIQWKGPEKANGILIKFNIFLKIEPWNIADMMQTDVCKNRERNVQHPRPQLPIVTPRTDPILTEGPEGCCSCSKDTPRAVKQSHVAGSVQFIGDVEDSIMNAIFVKNPDYDDNDNGSYERRRRRRSANESEPVGDSEELNAIKIFPYGTYHKGVNPKKVLEENMTIIAEVWANSSTNGKYSYTIKNLTHYTRYTIGIQACREPTNVIGDGIANDTDVCSMNVRDTARTLPSSTADVIDEKSIQVNVTGSDVKLKWDVPTSPNGLVLAYRIRVFDTKKTNMREDEECILNMNFTQNGRVFSFPKAFGPGNYSVSILVISLAVDSNFTAERFILIEESDQTSPTHYIAIFVPLLLILLVVILLAFYYVRQKGIARGIIISANPEYLPNVDIPEHWEVQRSKVELGKELGQGSFGVVYEAILKKFIEGFPRFPCAVKTVPLNSPGENKVRLLQEALMMTSMSCHHVVKLLAVVSKSQPTYLIMELMQLGDLKNYLRSRRPDSEYRVGEPPTFRQILRMSAETADGMAYLGNHSLVHRDLAARNCLLAEDLTVKICDFGLAKDVFETEYYRKTTRGHLPVRWMAPESIRDGVFTNKSDVWSFGVVLWEMVTLASTPYQGLDNEQVMSYVKGRNIMEKPEHCPEFLYDLMSACWRFEQQARPTFCDLLDCLVAEVDDDFRQISFYHSPEGLRHRSFLHNRREEEPPAKTPLKATFDELDDLDDLDDFGESEDLGGLSDSAAAREKLLPQPPACNGGVVASTTNNNNNRSEPPPFVALNVGAMEKLSSPSGGSADSTKNLTVAYSSEGGKAGPSNGYITLRHSPTGGV